MVIAVFDLADNNGMSIHRKHLHCSLIGRNAAYVENGEENEEGVDDEGEDVGEGSKGEGHDDQQQGEEEDVGGGVGDEPVAAEVVCCCYVCCSLLLLSTAQGLVWHLLGSAGCSNNDEKKEDCSARLAAQTDNIYEKKKEGGTGVQAKKVQQKWLLCYTFAG